MQAKLSLPEEGKLPFFYLGDDLKNLKVNLTFERPGPIEIDLSILTEVEQAVVFNNVSNGDVLCSVPQEELYSFFREMQGRKSLESSGSAAKPAVQEDSPAKSKKLAVQKVVIERKEKNQEIEKKIQYIVRKGVKSVLATLKDEEDPTILWRYKRAEIKGKKRATILSFLEKKLSKFQDQILENIEKSEGNTNLVSPIPSTQYDNNVIESDLELVQFAAGKPLK